MHFLVLFIDSLCFFPHGYNSISSVSRLFFGAYVNSLIREKLMETDWEWVREREKKERLIAHWWLFVHLDASTITYQKKKDSEHWWTCHCYLNVKRENLFEPLTCNTLESIGNYVYITNFRPWNYKWSVCHAHFWYHLYAPSNRNWNLLAVTIPWQNCTWHLPKMKQICYDFIQKIPTLKDISFWNGTHSIFRLFAHWWLANELEY